MSQKNNKHYKFNLSYILNLPDYWQHFPVEIELGEEFHHYCTRRVIKYKDSFDQMDYKMLGPDVDAISFLCFRVKKETPNLFIALQDKNIISPLVNHFAAQERCSGSYTDPETGSILLRRRKVAAPVNKTYDENEFDGVPFDKPNSMYVWLNGGLDSFLRIKKQDPNFINCLLKASSLRLCDLTRLDLAVDSSQDIMYYVTASIEKGYYGCDVHPFGYGWLGGKAIKGPIGRDSKYAERFKKEQLTLHTVYFGNQKNREKVVVFYDKKRENLKRFDGRWPLNTRVEARLLARTPEQKAKMMAVLDSYNDRENGWKKRMEVFVEEVMDTVRFTTKKRLRGAEKEKMDGIAPWWLAFIGTLVQSFIKQNEIKKLSSLGGQIEEPVLRSLLTTAIKDRDESSNEKKIRFEKLLEKAESLCDTMSYRTFYRGQNLSRLFPDKRVRDEAADLLKPLFAGFEKKEKAVKGENRKKGKKNLA